MSAGIVATSAETMTETALTTMFASLLIWPRPRNEISRRGFMPRRRSTIVASGDVNSRKSDAGMEKFHEPTCAPAPPGTSV